MWPIPLKANHFVSWTWVAESAFRSRARWAGGRAILIELSFVVETDGLVCVLRSLTGEVKLCATSRRASAKTFRSEFDTGD